MKVRVASLLGPCALVLIGSLACDAQEEDGPRLVPLEQVEAALSAEICDRMFSCRCEQGRVYQDAMSCEMQAARAAEQLESIPAQYPALDLTYDPACVGAVIDLYANVGCSPTIPLEDEEVCTRPCHYFYGTQQLGQSCQVSTGGATDCVQGLLCWGGQCQDPCDDSSDVYAQQGESCSPKGCAADLYCDFDSGETCQRPPQQGEACPQGFCAEDLMCDPNTAICQALPRAGEPCIGGLVCAEGFFCEPMDPNDPMFVPRCFGPQGLAASCRGHEQCESGYCPAGFCEVKPEEGEQCPANVCAEGLDCVETVCQPADAAICWANVPYF